MSNDAKTICDEIADVYKAKKLRDVPKEAYRRCLENDTYRYQMATFYRIDIAPPSLMDKARSLGRAVVKQLATGLTASDRLVEHRRSTCEGCDQLTPKGCKLCGCRAMDRKRKMPLERCPIGKWDHGWRVAVTTAPRGEYYLDTCLDSLLDAGFSQPKIFADHRSPLSYRAKQCDHVVQVRRAGAWRNWMEALDYVRGAEKYSLIVQDDVTLVPDLRWWLESQGDPVGLQLLVRSNGYGDWPINGWHRITPSEDGIIGAWALLMSPSAANDLFISELAQKWDEKWDHKDKPRSSKEHPAYIDGLVGKWFRDSSWPVWTHYPSLGQHIGQVSSLAHKCSGDHMRAGELFDAGGALNGMPARDSERSNDSARIASKS